jgi:multicomponent Na+:H+ antiporter subunit F
MTVWLAAALALLPPMAIVALAACRGPLAGRLVALQLASCITALLLAVLCFAVDQSSFIDLSLCLALLNLPGTLVLAVFTERWL